MINYKITVEFLKSLNIFAEIICPIDSLKFKLLEGQGKYPRKNWISIDERKPKLELIKTKIIKIEETPHYKLLCGNENEYKEYLNKNKWKNYGTEHSYDNFKQLIYNFDISQVVITCKKINDKLIIKDGLHRMSILMGHYDIYKNKEITLILPYTLTIAQLITKNKDRLSLHYPFGELKKKQLDFFNNKKQEMNVRIENLKELITILNGFNIKYWLQGKTLLGMVRDNKLIENDHDEDIGVMESNMINICLKIIPILEKNGFKVIRATQNNSMLSLMKNFRYIDICFFTTKKDKIGYEKKVFPKKFYNSFVNLNIDDFNYTIPLNYKEIIKYSYNIKI